MLNLGAERGTRSGDLSVPRLGFVGVGWIGRQRMEVLAASGAGEVAVVADADENAAREAAAAVGCSRVGNGLEEALSAGVDGVVIATPSGLHAGQAIKALEHGVAVFCQKPLGRDAQETRAIVRHAQAADRLLGLDLSYRRTEAIEAAATLIRDGRLGRIFSADLTFHNAYGPDKPWVTDPRLSGGGCVMDLGTHLVDLALWLLDGEASDVRSALYSKGRRLRSDPAEIEDYASAEVRIGGCQVRIACSWFLNAGRDAVIDLVFYGTDAAVRVCNVGGSFYDLRTELLTNTEAETLTEPPDEWGGKMLVDWARRLAADPGFDPQAFHYVRVAEVLDAIYGKAS